MYEKNKKVIGVKVEEYGEERALMGKWIVEIKGFQQCKVGINLKSIQERFDITLIYVCSSS